MLSFETVTTVRTENTVLYHGNCLGIMPQLPENSVDLALIDPPFGLTRNQWDTVIPLPPPMGESGKSMQTERRNPVFQSDAVRRRTGNEQQAVVPV